MGRRAAYAVLLLVAVAASVAHDHTDAQAHGVCDALAAAPLRDLSAALCRIANPPDAASTLLHGIVVERHGKILAERYFTSQDRPVGDLFSHPEAFDAAALHDLRSISKSVVSMAIGAAMQQGKLRSLDVPVIDFLPDLAGEVTDSRFKQITLRHLLTMSAGLDWDEDGSVSLFSNETRMEFSRDMVRYVLHRRVSESPGVRYVYDSGCAVLLGAVLERVTGTPLEEYVRIALLRPLGIDAFEWRRSLFGQVMSHAGLRLRPRDLATLGNLIIANGRWNGVQIISEDYLRESIQGQFAAESDWRYGFLWRLGTMPGGGRDWHWIGGFGNGGQRLFIVPELDLVIVIHAGRYNEPDPGNGAPSYALFERLLDEVARSSA